MTYKELKASYEAFKKKLPEDLFTRYSRELSYVRSLAKSAKTQGLEQDVFEYQKIEEASIKKLRELGYKVK